MTAKEQPLHIVLISRSFPHHRTGGMEWHVHDIAEGLLDAGHHVTVVTTPLPEYPALEALPESIRVLEIGKKSGAYDLKFFYQSWKETATWIRQRRPDIVHAQGYAGMALWPKLRGDLPMLTTVHGTLWSETEASRSLWKMASLREKRQLLWRYKHRLAFTPLWRAFLKSGAPIIVDSKFSAKELKQELGFRPNIESVVPLGFNLNRFPLEDHVQAREQWKLEPGDRMLLFLGRLEETKGARLIFEAFLSLAKELPNAHLVIAGTGSLESELRVRAERSHCGDRIRVLGKVGSTVLPSLFAAADYFVNPDKGSPAFGLVNAEALCQGTPVIASANGAHGEIVRGPEHGRLLESNSVESWIEALKEAIAEEPEITDQRKQRAEEARTRYGRDRMIKRLLRVYGKLVGGEEVEGGRPRPLL